MGESSDDDESGSEAAEDEVFNMYKDTLLSKGIKTKSKNARQINTAKPKDKVSLPPIDAHKSKPATSSNK